MNPKLRIWLIVWLGILSGCGHGTPGHSPSDIGTSSVLEHAPNAAAHPVDTIAEAFRDHRSHLWVEGAGTVIRLLRDDTKRPRHQRFIVDLGNGMTVLIAHNIDLAARVPFKKGDVIRFRGEYIWNDQGGLVHETHRDPRGSKDSGGWIRWRDFVYR